MNNFNKTQIKKYIYQDEIRNSAAFGVAISYIVMISTKLSLLLLRHPELASRNVAITCFINQDAYADTHQIITSRDGRNTGVVLRSNAISKSASINQFGDSSFQKIIIFDRKPVHINLGALATFLSAITPQYDERITHNARNQSMLRNAMYSADSMHNTDLAELVRIDCNCITKIPDIESVDFAQGDNDQDLISWFEPFYESKVSRYREEAILLMEQYREEEEATLMKNAEKRSSNRRKRRRL